MSGQLILERRELKRASKRTHGAHGRGVRGAAATADPSSDVEGTYTTRKSNFYMIDLAGSEAFDYTAGTPIRGINAGLVALGRVLMAMSDKVR